MIHIFLRLLSLYFRRTLTQQTTIISYDGIMSQLATQGGCRHLFFFFFFLLIYKIIVREKGKCYYFFLYFFCQNLLILFFHTQKKVFFSFQSFRLFEYSFSCILLYDSYLSVYIIYNILGDYLHFCANTILANKDYGKL